MTGGPQAPENVGQNPKTNLDQEVMPETRTFDTNLLRKYLKDKVTLPNFDQQFTLDLMIDFSAQEPTAKGREIHELFKNAQEIMRNHNLEHAMYDVSRNTIEGRLATHQTPPGTMTAQEAKVILEAYDHFQQLKGKAKRILYVKEATQKRLEASREGREQGNDIQDFISNTLNNAKENWDDYSGGMKLLLAGGALVGTIMLVTSNNQAIQNVRQQLWRAAPWVGGGFLAWHGTKILSGKTPWEWATEGGAASTRDSNFFKEAFNANADQADALVESIVKMGDYDFLDLANKYQRASGTKRIDGVGMDPNAAYVALDVFFKKYGLDKTRSKHRLANPRLSYREVMVIEMTEDKSLDIKDNVGQSLFDYAGGATVQTERYIARSRPGQWVRNAYLYLFPDSAPQNSEIDRIRAHFNFDAKDDVDLDRVIDNDIASTDREMAVDFKTTRKSGTRSSQYNLRYKELNGYTYIISEAPLDATTMKDENRMKAKVQEVKDNASLFLSNSKNISKADAEAGSQLPDVKVFVADGPKAYYMTRYKKA